MRIIFLQTMTNFEPLHKLQAHDGYILKCLLSPEFCEPNRYCISFYEQCIQTLRIKQCMPFSFRYLATASSDHTVKIWNVDGFTLEKTLVG